MSDLHVSRQFFTVDPTYRMDICQMLARRFAPGVWKQYHGSRGIIAIVAGAWQIVVICGNGFDLCDIQLSCGQATVRKARTGNRRQLNSVFANFAKLIAAAQIATTPDS